MDRYDPRTLVTDLLRPEKAVKRNIRQFDKLMSGNILIYANREGDITGRWI